LPAAIVKLDPSAEMDAMRAAPAMEVHVHTGPGLSTRDGAGRREIVETALRLARQAGGWDAVHVHAVAREAGLTLVGLQRHFRDKDAIAEGLFDLADEAMLRAAESPGWGELAARERLFRTMLAWFEALQPHRREVRAMLGYKLHPEHLHLQARGIMRISRTVQWVRETAQLGSVGWRRELEEATLTTIYLATFAHWLADGSSQAQRTQRLLQHLLARAGQAATWLRFPG
jgi:ubiquinone biosynthesis protein COQ9